jgi:hypothetical protein
MVRSRHMEGTMGKWLLGLGILLLTVSLAWGQTSNSTITGTVRDQSGGVIPGAEVIITNTATGVSASTLTNDAGMYFHPGAIPGPYQITVDWPGMAKKEVTFTVRVAQKLSIDLVLTPGELSTTVEVSDVTPVVTLSNATVASTVERARIEQLPMNGREIFTLLKMLPGSEGDGRRMFGLHTMAQEWVVDGVPVQDQRWSMVLDGYNPGLGAIQEFTVNSSAISAKDSKPSNVIIATKSGTDSFHGSLYEVTRNSGFGVARRRTDYFAKPPLLIRHEFGANAGAPVYIPGIYDGRGKTFWFFNYEGFRQREPITRGFSVPTAAMRAGDFSELRDAQGRLLTLYDPWTTDPTTSERQPFRHNGKLNVIDPARMSPVAKYLFDITPLPTTSANPLVDTNLWRQTPYSWDKTVYITRIDHRFSEKDSIFGRFTMHNINNLTTYTGHGVTWNMGYLNDVAGWKISRDRARHGVITWYHTFSPTFHNELLVSGRYHSGRGTTGKDELAKNWYDELKMPNPFGAYDWPQFTGTGLSGYAITGPGWDQEGETYYNVDNNTTAIKGKHQITFGGRYRRDHLNLLPNNGGQASVSFNTLATALYDSKSSPVNPQVVPQTGHNLANMFIGSSTYNARLMRNWVYLRSGNTALYFQDDWKATPRLTLNLGLRWEYWPAYREKRNLVVGFDEAGKRSVLGTSMQSMYDFSATLPSIVNAYQNLGWNYTTYDEIGLPQELVDPRSKNFGPRLGLAYRALDGKKSFVIRGGYSLSYFAIDVNSWINDMTGNTPFSGTFTYNPDEAVQSPDGIPRYTLRSTPLFINGVNDRNVISFDQPRGITRGSASATSFARNLPDSRSHSWNFTLEKEVMASTVVRARYVGSHTDNLLQFMSLNDEVPPYIWYMTTGQQLPTGEFASVARRPYDQQVLGNVRRFESTGWGNTQSASLELERRFNQGLGFQLSYVMTNALYAGSRSTIPGLHMYLPNTVSSDYDTRNRFLNYQRDTGIPKHRVQWNWLADLPFGRGKLLGGNAGGVLDKFIGGWQLAGIGSIRSNWFTLPTGNWNITGEPIKMYGYQYPIQNCTSGTCIPGYLWWNGYIPANRINSVDANGKPNGYMGVPDDYKPAVSPLIPWGSTTLPANAPPGTNVASFWDTNNVWVPLKDGSVQRLGYNNNLHPWRNQYLPGVRQWRLDVSLYKNLPITEEVGLRINLDVFNVFNAPNNPNSIGGDGFLNTRSSGIDPRVMQVGLHLKW